MPVATSVSDMFVGADRQGTGKRYPIRNVISEKSAVRHTAEPT